MSVARHSIEPVITANTTIRQLIETQAERCGDRVFLLDPDTGQSVTYRELHSSVRSVADHLTRLKIDQGQSIAYALSNGHDCAITILGILYGGFRATAINLIAGAKTISYVLDHSQARLIISQARHSELLDQAQEGATSQVKRLDIVKLFQEDDERIATDQSASLLPDNDGLLMYTSGTTGQPKGVVLSHKNLVAGGLNAASAHELGRDDRALCVLPLYHINGLCVTLIGSLVSGGSLVIPSQFSSSAFWDQVRDNECTWFSVVPTQISYLLHDDKSGPETRLQKVRFGRSASAPLSPDVQSSFERRFGIPIIETMGLTETAAQILSNPLPPGLRKVGSPGIAVGNEVIIADNNCVELARGLEGEVLVRGPNVMGRYLNNAEITRQAFGAGGWLKTGDLGRMDADGYVFITGRSKELIIKGGENIAPREVDEALYAHPDIIEAAAFARPSNDYGQTVEAAVSIRENSQLTQAALLEFFEQPLGKFKTPDKIYFLDELPKGPSGKIQRIKISELIERSHNK